jgi:hypothetical protein
MMNDIAAESVHAFVHTLVQQILMASLDAPESYPWSIQGFGMLRLYLPGDMRLNVWLSKYQIPGVSVIHTHPWNFDSLIERGTLTNIRYQRLSDGVHTHDHALLRPGPNGGLMRKYGGATLRAFDPEHYGMGMIYHQEADEIHQTITSDGCVTINMRQRVGADEALTFWPAKTEWVSAEPRKATTEEIADFCKAALSVQITSHGLP